MPVVKSLPQVAYCFNINKTELKFFTVGTGSGLRVGSAGGQQSAPPPQSVRPKDRERDVQTEREKREIL